jgi:predicted metalloprotease with PDZ domain
MEGRGFNPAARPVGTSGFTGWGKTRGGGFMRPRLTEDIILGGDVKLPLRAPNLLSPQPVQPLSQRPRILPVLFVGRLRNPRSRIDERNGVMLQVMLMQIARCASQLTNRFRARVCLGLAAFYLAVTSIAFCQTAAGPEPVPLPPPVTTPVDTQYPGTIGLQVDVSDVAHRVIVVHETIPVQPGELTLLYPEWIPGNHSPTGPISEFSDLDVTAKGKRISWVRDRVNMYAFHIRVPTGMRTIGVRFQYLAPIRGDEGRISFSSNILDLAWNRALLYPAGHFSRDIQFAPSIRLPGGWHFASALEVRAQNGTEVRVKDTPLNTLVDSPLYAGVNFKREDLSTGPSNRVFLDIFADSPKDLAITPQELQLHRNLVLQAQRLFKSHHYHHYDFLFSVSDTVGGIGLEHHQSSEDGTSANYFTDWRAGIFDRDLLAHEYTHSWNGKFRRPADLWTPNFNVPMQDDLLWVYEGMTQYFGYVLTARAGLRSPAETRDLIAMIAANFDVSPGSSWRPLIDTTNQPVVSERHPVPWVSWLRDEDYYMDGLLIWLDADTKIRELSGGKKSLDDFARLFFAIDDGSTTTRTYAFKDIVAALNTVQPYDWATFLRSRIYKLDPRTPEDGITRGGYHLTYSDTPPDWLKDSYRPDSYVNFATSLGFSVKANGDLGSVWWDSPAFKAGMTSDMHLDAVNGKAFSLDVLRDAIRDAEKDTSAIRLLVKRGKEFETLEINYHRGLRYPKLSRVEAVPDRLDEILAPK